MVEGPGLDSTGSGYGPVRGSCEHKRRGIRDYLGDY
jgi:hypothetical protein